jgi:hypothetical protein
VSQPRIAAFARLANGNIEPTRIIEGEKTKLGRTLHGVAYNPLRDEIVVGNPLASSLLVFRGSASGNEAPVRVIQGSRTTLAYPDVVNIDAENQEILAVDAGRVLVFPWTAEGNTAPSRVISITGTKMKFGHGVGVDHERNLLVVTGTTEAGEDGLLVFNRTDNGKVTPRAVIAGPKTGIEKPPWQLQVHRGRIYVTVANTFYSPLYSQISIRPGISPDTEIKSPWRTDRVGFIGVWNTTDNGDVPPRAIIKGPASGIIHAGGLALNVRNNEVFVVDTVRNGLFTYLVPGLF